MTTAEEVFAALDGMGIAYDRAAHAPAHHIEDCIPIAQSMGATVCKNYFLTTKSKRLYALLLTRPEARLVTKDVSRQAGTPRLMFAEEAPLEAMLRTHPGAVSPMGLVFDREQGVRFLMDRSLLALPRLAFHPCDNTMTLAMSTRDFTDRFLPATGHGVTYVDIRDTIEASEER